MKKIIVFVLIGFMMASMNGFAQNFNQNPKELPLQERPLKQGRPNGPGRQGGKNGLQNNKRDGSRVEALKIAFITRKLDLSPEEAQKFWPIFNKYSEELKKTHQDLRNGTSGEIEKEEKMLSLRKKYYQEFQKAVNIEKANNYFRIEKEFMSILQKEMQQRRENMGRKGGGPPPPHQ
jgi:hypothetical protein